MTESDISDISAMTEQEQLAVIRSKLGDKWWRMNNLYMIENEQGQLVRFRLRPAQELLFKMMWWLNIILKARQLGFSTAIDIYLLDEALFNKNLKCGIIAQDLTAAGEIFRTKIEIPFDNLPDWLRSRFIVTSRSGGKNGGAIFFKHGSSIQVATSFRSGTLQRLHVSEHGKICAKYPEKAKEVRTGTLQAIHPGAIAFIESTAEGVGGDFHAMSMKSLELAKSGGDLTQLDWKFHFFAWWQDPKYSASVPASGVIMSKDQSEYFDAVELAMDCTITDEQRQWYVLKEATLGDEMKQEFPSTPLEAFLTSGRRVFAPTMTMRAEGDCRPPELVYDMDPVTGKRERGNGPDMLDERGQRSLANLLLVWELPDPEEDYAIGVDISEGLEHGDRSSFDVVKRSNGEQVAHWFGHLDPGLLAQLVAHVGRWYGSEEHGQAFVGPERNNHGHAFLLRLRDIYPTRRIYAQNDLCGDMDYMGTGVVTAQSADGPLNGILVDGGLNLTPPLLDRAVEAMQRAESAAVATSQDRLQTGSDVIATERASQIATEQAAVASASAVTGSIQAGDAAISAGAAAGSASSAQKWAENPVDVAVVTGKYSALHHATKANVSASESAASATATAASASTASSKATSASTTATTATTKASEAATSASTAATHASAANSSKVSADTSATNTGTHASNAEKAVQAAEGAKVVTLDNAAKVGTLAEQVTADHVQVQEKATQVAAHATTVAGQVKEVSTNTEVVSQAKAAVQGMRDVVVAKTAQAQAAADTASCKASQAAQAQASANASVSEGMAEAWSQNPEGSDINGRPGEFSALHWALQTQKWAQAITSQLVWAGPWNAAAGAPVTPAANQGGPFYRISHSGVVVGTSYVAGDYLHWDPATRTWFKIDGSDAVVSVNGMTGAVVLSAADVGARSASWVPGWADITNKPVTMPPSEHSHPWSQLSMYRFMHRAGPLAEVGAAAASHTHPWAQLTGIPAYATRWPAWGEVTDKPDLALATRRHPWSQLDQIPVTASRWPTWSEVTGKPSIAAAAHRQPLAELWRGGRQTRRCLSRSSASLEPT